MNCHTCQKEMKREIADKYPFPESGLELELIGWAVWKCACGVVMPETRNPEQFQIALVSVIIRQTERLDGDAILFLRKRMGLTGIQMAQRLGVNRVEVSRWENDTNDISPHLDLKVRLEAIDELIPQDERTALKLIVLNIMHRLYRVDGEVTIPRQLARTGELAFA